MRGRYEVDENLDLDIAVPVVDGTALYEMLKDRFYGISTRLVAPPSRHLFGSPRYGEDGLTALLDGDCLVVGCCGVMARVVVTEDSVEWTDFFARGRPELPPGLRFVFDRSQYEAAARTVGELDAEPFPPEL